MGEAKKKRERLGEWYGKPVTEGHPDYVPPATKSDDACGVHVVTRRRPPVLMAMLAALLPELVTTRHR